MCDKLDSSKNPLGGQLALVWHLHHPLFPETQETLSAPEITPVQPITVEKVLALVYNQNIDAAIAVGEVCDNCLDRSGALLGRVRELAYKLSEANK